MEWVRTLSVVHRMVFGFPFFSPFFSRDCVFISGPALLSAEIQQVRATGSDLVDSVDDCLL